jgi:hypothetical protein
LLCSATVAPRAIVNGSGYLGMQAQVLDGEILLLLLLRQIELAQVLWKGCAEEGESLVVLEPCRTTRVVVSASRVVCYCSPNRVLNSILFFFLLYKICW